MTFVHFLAMFVCISYCTPVVFEPYQQIVQSCLGRDDIFCAIMSSLEGQVINFLNIINYTYTLAELIEFHFDVLTDTNIELANLYDRVYYINNTLSTTIYNMNVSSSSSNATLIAYIDGLQTQITNNRLAMNPINGSTIINALAIATLNSTQIAASTFANLVNTSLSTRITTNTNSIATNAARLGNAKILGLSATGDPMTPGATKVQLMDDWKPLASTYYELKFVAVSSSDGSSNISINVFNRGTGSSVAVIKRNPILAQDDYFNYRLMMFASTASWYNYSINVTWGGSNGYLSISIPYVTPILM